MTVAPTSEPTTLEPTRVPSPSPTTAEPTTSEPSAGISRADGDDDDGPDYNLFDDELTDPLLSDNWAPNRFALQGTDAYNIASLQLEDMPDWFWVGASSSLYATDTRPPAPSRSARRSLSAVCALLIEIVFSNR